MRATHTHPPLRLAQLDWNSQLPVPAELKARGAGAISVGARSAPPRPQGVQVGKRPGPAQPACAPENSPGLCTGPRSVLSQNLLQVRSPSACLSSPQSPDSRTRRTSTVTDSEGRREELPPSIDIRHRRPMQIAAEVAQAELHSLTLPAYRGAFQEPTRSTLRGHSPVLRRPAPAACQP